jgi:hypothetical protein
MQLVENNPRSIDKRGVYFNHGRTKIFIVGVIDTLTEYTTKKKAEYYAKKCKHGME